MSSLSTLQNLKNKNIAVIGGSGYLGRAACEVCAELGGNIIVASRNKQNCEETAQNLVKNIGQNHIGIDCDITCKKSVEKFHSIIKDKYKKIDVLIISAWNGKKNTWDSIEQEDWDNEMDVCLNSNFRIIKKLQDILGKPAKIILVSSMYGLVSPNPNLYQDVPQSNPPSYGVAKAGIIQFTKYLAVWLAKEKINVNCISPGPFPFPKVIEDHNEFCDRLKKSNPLNKIGKPHELKGVFALLATDASNFITGQNICVDGGWTIW